MHLGHQHLHRPRCPGSTSPLDRRPVGTDRRGRGRPGPGDGVGTQVKALVDAINRPDRHRRPRRRTTRPPRRPAHSPATPRVRDLSSALLDAIAPATAARSPTSASRPTATASSSSTRRSSPRRTPPTPPPSAAKLTGAATRASPPGSATVATAASDQVDGTAHHRDHRPHRRDRPAQRQHRGLGRPAGAAADRRSPGSSPPSRRRSSQMNSQSSWLASQIAPRPTHREAKEGDPMTTPTRAPPTWQHPSRPPAPPGCSSCSTSGSSWTATARVDAQRGGRPRRGPRASCCTRRTSCSSCAVSLQDRRLGRRPGAGLALRLPARPARQGQHRATTSPSHRCLPRPGRRPGRTTWREAALPDRGDGVIGPWRPEDRDASCSRCLGAGARPRSSCDVTAWPSACSPTPARAAAPSPGTTPSCDGPIPAAWWRGPWHPRSARSWSSERSHDALDRTRRHRAFADRVDRATAPTPGRAGVRRPPPDPSHHQRPACSHSTPDRAPPGVVRLAHSGGRRRDEGPDLGARGDELPGLLSEEVLSRCGSRARKDRSPTEGPAPVVYLQEARVPRHARRRLVRARLGPRRHRAAAERDRRQHRQRRHPGLPRHERRLRDVA